MYGYLNGKILPEEEMHVSPRDLGLLRGYAVFDVMPVFNGKLFRAEDHWKRLEGSADVLHLALPITRGEWEKIVLDLVQKNPIKNVSVRTVCTGGVSASGMDPEEGKETLCILIDEFKEFPAKWYEEGVKVLTKKHARMFPEAKMTDYIFPIMHRAEKQNAGAVEIIYISDNKAFEASTSNFCIVKNGVIASPGSEVLGGITRKVVREIARDGGIPFESREVTTKELFDADEMFLTASNKHVLPVRCIDGRKVGNGTIGPVTKRVMEAFRRSIMR